MSNAIRYVIIEEPVYNDLVGTLDRIIVQLDRINAFMEPFRLLILRTFNNETRET